MANFLEMQIGICRYIKSKKGDWDFMKVNPRAEYHVEDWGNIYAYSGNDYIKPKFKEGCIKDVDD